MDDSTSIYNWFTEYFKPTFETTTQKKRFISKYLLLIYNVPYQTRGLTEKYY